MTIQAIVNHSQSSTITFSGKPNEATRERLRAAGFLYKGSSRWVRSINESDIVTEENVAAIIGA
jgi:hypothetical protein